ncbi:MAG: cob(I)yrinic acid a,c-diamide adenosyltransferase [Fimbriimonas sp.]
MARAPEPEQVFEDQAASEVHVHGPRREALKIYTRTGDDGTTGLLGGTRVPKCSARIVAIGEVDELNAVVGLALCSALEGRLKDELCTIQNLLFDMGAELASPSDGRIQAKTLAERHARFLEGSMDRMSDDLPPLKQFILPGGSELAARLHLARAICRRAERSVLELHETEPQRAELLVFLNRLSDWLFLAARTANASQGVLDIAWQKSEEI